MVERPRENVCGPSVGSAKRAIFYGMVVVPAVPLIFSFALEPGQAAKWLTRAGGRRSGAGENASLRSRKMPPA